MYPILRARKMYYNMYNCVNVIVFMCFITCLLGVLFAQSKGLHPENSKRLQARRLDKPDDSEKETENKRKPSRKPVCWLYSYNNQFLILRILINI